MITECPKRLTSNDTCSGVIHENAISLGVSNEIMTANIIIFALSLFYFISTFIWSYQYRKTSSIFSSVRPYRLVMSLFIPCLICVFAVPGRFILPFMSNCRAHYFLLMMIAPTFSTVYTIRLLILISKASQIALSRMLSMDELNKLAKQHKKRTNFITLMNGLLQLPDFRYIKHSDSLSPTSSFASIAINENNNNNNNNNNEKLKSSEHVHSNEVIPMNSTTLLTSSSIVATNSKAGVLGTGGDELSSTNIINKQDKISPTDQRKINALAGTLKIKRRFLYIVLFILLIPVILSTAILFATKDVFIGDCNNCSIYYEFLIVLVASVSLAATLAGIIIFKLRTYPDHQGSWFEIKIILSFTFIISISTVVLLLVDPGDYQRNHLVQWEWLILLLMIISWTTSVVYRVYLARKDSIELKKALSNSEWTPDIELLEKDDETATEWNFYVRKAMIDETWRFLREVGAYKEKFSNLSESEVVHKAENIINTFIAQEAPLQINIDASRRREIEKYYSDDFRGCNMYELFDKAYGEVKHLIIEDGWKRFISKNPKAMQRLKKVVMDEKLRQSRGLIGNKNPFLRSTSKFMYNMEEEQNKSNQ